MMRHWLKSPKALVVTPLLLVLVIAAACGGTAATPVIVEKEVIKEVIKEVPVVKEVVKEIVVVATPLPVVQAQPTSAPIVEVVAGGIRGGVMPQLDYADVRQRTLLASTVNNKNVAMMFSGLVEYNPENSDPTEIRCDLCTSWDLAADGMTYTFELNEQAKFSDGHPVTSEDVAYMLLAATCPECIPIRDGETVSTAVQMKAYYEDSQIIDDYTIEIKTLFPSPAFLLALGSETLKVLPKHVEDAGKLQTTSEMGDLVGSGPFIHVKQVKAVSNHYERNPNYFKDGLPYLDGLDQFIIVDSGAGIAAFKAEQVLMSNGADNFSDAEVLVLVEEEAGKLVLQWGIPEGVQFMFFNTQAKPFDDVRVRRAVHLAMDREALNDTFTAGQGIPIGTHFPPGLGFAYTNEEAAQLPGMRYVNGEKDPDDLAEGRRLLAEAGIPEQGFEVLLSTRNCCAYPDISAVVIEQLKEAYGWKVDLKVWESAAGFNAYRDHDFSFVVQRRNAVFADPDAFLDANTEGRLLFRWTGRVTPGMQELFDKQARELNVEKRREFMVEIEELLTEDAISTNLYWRRNHQVFNERVKNFFFKQSIRKYETIWCDPQC
jgi:peptide/nickel transport system substrate-binding protein